MPQLPQPTPQPPQEYDPCHLWQDAVNSGATKIEQGVQETENGNLELGAQLIEEGIALIEGNALLLERCRLDHPGSGPTEAPVSMQAQQKPMRQISDSKVLAESESNDQRTIRRSLVVIEFMLNRIRQATVRP